MALTLVENESQKKLAGQKAFQTGIAVMKRFRAQHGYLPPNAVIKMVDEQSGGLKTTEEIDAFIVGLETAVTANRNRAVISDIDQTR